MCTALIKHTNVDKFSLSCMLISICFVQLHCIYKVGIITNTLMHTHMYMSCTVHTHTHIHSHTHTRTHAHTHTHTHTHSCTCTVHTHTHIHSHTHTRTHTHTHTHTQVLDSSKRLGCDQMGGYEPLKEHIFFEDIEWDTLHKQVPPKLMPYLPSCTKGEQGLRSEIDVSIA